MNEAEIDQPIDNKNEKEGLSYLGRAFYDALDIDPRDLIAEAKQELGERKSERLPFLLNTIMHTLTDRGLDIKTKIRVDEQDLSVSDLLYRILEEDFRESPDSYE